MILRKARFCGAFHVFVHTPFSTGFLSSSPGTLAEEDEGALMKLGQKPADEIGIPFDCTRMLLQLAIFEKNFLAEVMTKCEGIVTEQRVAAS